MTFEVVEKVCNKRSESRDALTEVIKQINDSDAEVVVLKGWEDFYSKAGSVAATAKNICREMFPNIQVSTSEGRVFLKKVSE